MDSEFWPNQKLWYNSIDEGGSVDASVWRAKVLFSIVGRYKNMSKM